jgi:hypothetical protein
MKQSEQPEIVTVVASPPAGTLGSTDNTFIDTVLAELRSKSYGPNRIIRAASVRDIDLELSKIVTERFRGTFRLQIVGHSISGMLSLGASWIAEQEVAGKAFRWASWQSTSAGSRSSCSSAAISARRPRSVTRSMAAR